MTLHDTDIFEKLNVALDNPDNSSIQGLTSRTIKTQINDVLQNIGFDRDTLKSYHTKLKSYRFVEDLNGLKYGAYVRWIDLLREPITLTTGGIVCGIDVTANGIALTCKNYRGAFFRCNFTECVVFQKLTDQEAVIVAALDLIESK